jgi:ubiquinone biosynthesis protein UbiJ
MIQDSEPQANKTLWWILGSVFAVAMVLMNVVSSMRAAAIDDTKNTANEAKTIANEAKTMGIVNNTAMEYLTKQVDAINVKMDKLLELRGVSSIPKPSI